MYYIIINQIKSGSRAKVIDEVAFRSLNENKKLIDIDEKFWDTQSNKVLNFVGIKWLHSKKITREKIFWNGKNFKINGVVMLYNKINDGSFSEKELMTIHQVLKRNNQIGFGIYIDNQILKKNIDHINDGTFLNHKKNKREKNLRAKARKKEKRKNDYS